MDINTRLEDDLVLFAKYKNTISRGKIIQSFNRLGIYTVNDLINTNPNLFSDKSKDQFIAIANIFRYEYEGKPFAFEYIFNKIYDLEDDIIELAKDIKTLGIVKDYKYVPDRLNECLVNYASKHISMDYVLGLCYYNARDLANYYVDYIEKTRGKERSVKTKIMNIEQPVIIPNNDVNLVSANTLEIEIKTLNNVLNDLKLKIENKPSLDLFQLKQQLEITIIEKQNQLNALRGKDYTRVKSSDK